METYDNLPKILPFTNDIVFKMMFKAPEAELIRRGMISAFTGLEVHTAVIIDPEPTSSNIESKREVFDVNCETNIGLVCVEMQASHMDGDSTSNNHQNIRTRSLFGGADLFSNQSVKGQRYSEINKTFQITICDYNAIHETDEFLTKFQARSGDGIVLSDSLTFVYVELKKLQKILQKPDSEFSYPEMWAIILEYIDKPQFREKISGIINKKEEFQMAYEMIQDVSDNPNVREFLRQKRKADNDFEHTKKVMRDEGKAEGIAIGKAEGMLEGIFEGKLEVARAMLFKNMSLIDISLFTGLPENEIKKLKR
jgi:predicted transposase/invertase (TIGR01784 family)